MGTGVVPKENDIRWRNISVERVTINESQKLLFIYKF